MLLIYSTFAFGIQENYHDPLNPYPGLHIVPKDKQLDLIKKVGKQFIKEKQKALVESKKAKASDIEMSLCVECKTAIKFTNSINAILKEMPESKDFGSETSHEIAKLAAVSQFVQYIDSRGNRHCFEKFDEKFTKEFREIPKDDLRLVFSKDFDFDSFLGLNRYQSRERAQFFIRGLGKDSNKVIRISMERGKMSRLDYFVIDNFSSLDLEHIYQKDADFARYNLPQLGDPKMMEKADRNAHSGRLDYSMSLDSQTEDSKTTGFLGPKVEYERYLPVGITLAEINNHYNLTEDIKIESALKIDHKDQYGDIRVKSADGDTFTYFKLKSSGEVKIGIPYQATDILDSKFSISGNLEYSTDENTRSITSRFGYDGDNFLNASLVESNNGTSLVVGKDFFLDNNNQVISIKYQKSPSGSRKDEEERDPQQYDFTQGVQGDETVWVSFMQRF